MPMMFIRVCAGLLLASVAGLHAADKSIVLIAGEVKPVDKTGHHDYTGGVALLRDVLQQTPGIITTVVTDGWPTDATLLTTADSVVFYTDGGGKQAYLTTPERIAIMNALAARGAGIVQIHQAVDYSEEHVERAKAWIGGVYAPKVSGRGHWDSQHNEFPTHPITQGVTPWSINDGWLTAMVFVPDKKGITPLVWSSKEHSGKATGGDAAIVAWTYDRPQGGRSFSFTGLDAHGAWKLAGMRQLVVNGILWTAGCEIPSAGARCAMDDATIDKHLTPRVDGKKLFGK